MQDAKQIRRHIAVVSIALFVLFAVTIGSSYSAYFRVKSTSSSQSIQSGSLDVNESTSNVIQTNIKILSDAQGLAQSEYASISISNSGTLESSYFLTLAYNASSGDVVIPFEYIKMALFDNSGNPITGAFSLGDCPVASAGTSVATAYQTSVTFFYKDSIAPGATDHYRVKIWLSDEYSIVDDYEYLDGVSGSFIVKSDFVVSASERYKINISTTSADSTYNIMNSSLTGSFTSSGTTLNLAPGTYTYTIGATSGLYVLKVQRGSTFSLTRRTPVASGTPTMKFAYDNVTTLRWSVDVCEDEDDPTGENSVYCNITSSNNQLYQMTFGDGETADKSLIYRTFILTIPENHPVEIPINLSLETTGTTYAIGLLTIKN